MTRKVTVDLRVDSRTVEVPEPLSEDWWQTYYNVRNHPMAQHWNPGTEAEIRNDKDRQDEVDTEIISYLAGAYDDKALKVEAFWEENAAGMLSVAMAEAPEEFGTSPVGQDPTVNVYLAGQTKYASITGLSDKQARTLLYGLEEYAKNLKKTLEETRGSEHALEEAVFCYDELATISALKFSIMQFSNADDLKWVDYEAPGE